MNLSDLMPQAQHCATCGACGWSAAASSVEHSNTLMITHRAVCPGKGAKHDGGKPAYHLIPPGVLVSLADVLTYGAGKYAPGNWKKVPDAQDRYYSAMMRHVEAWRMGQRKDEESGLPHLAHALCCLVFIAAFDNGEASK